jgi:hypothetical protein
MINVVKVTLFLMVNFFGFYVMPHLAKMAKQMHIYPRLPPIDNQLFEMLYFGAGRWGVWGFACLLSVLFFITQGEKRYWFLLAPLFAPIIYGIGMIIYFRYFYTV